jgi:hypothetical protein
VGEGRIAFSTTGSTLRGVALHNCQKNGCFFSNAPTAGAAPRTNSFFWQRHQSILQAALRVCSIAPVKVSPKKCKDFETTDSFCWADFPIVGILTCVGEGKIAFSTTGITLRGVALHNCQKTGRFFSNAPTAGAAPRTNSFFWQRHQSILQAALCVCSIAPVKISPQKRKAFETTDSFCWQISRSSEF